MILKKLVFSEVELSVSVVVRGTINMAAYLKTAITHAVLSN